MHTQSKVRPWVAVLLIVLISASVGFVAYRVGFGHGVAQGVAMNLAAAGPEAAKVAPYGPYPYPAPYGWHGHWGWGWGFFPFGFFVPFLFFALWFFALRMLFWGGPWRGGRWRGGPWPRRGWYDDRRL